MDVNSEEHPRYHHFNQFAESVDLLQIVDNFRKLCNVIGVNPDSCENVYASLKCELTNWKCRDIWNLLDKRMGFPEYSHQTACKRLSVLVVGAGPVGLRAAIESAMLGARVDVVEKRTSFSRNNVLHLWPFVITDLISLGAKKFYGKFCTGSINHMSIRILQAFLLKICLLVGVRIHSGVKFTGLIEPTDAEHGWSVVCTPTVSVLSARYDTIIAADGKQKSLPGFQFKQFRAKLALAITVNFVNGNTQQENAVDEISGVSYVYNQEFFKNLSETHGIELENIVYYKDETHYFVMTAKKSSLLKKGVIKQDQSDPHQLLSTVNVNHNALEAYAVEAATFATHGGLGELTFALNHLGEHDVALFDFTSLFAAENASRIIERNGQRLLMLIAGDSLLEPFWPTGSGCARGFLGAFDAAWTLKGFAGGRPPLELIEEREAIYYLLPQTTPERLHKDITAYTIDPKSRYPNLNEAVPPQDVSYLYETDSPTVASTFDKGLKNIPQVKQSAHHEPPMKTATPTSHSTLLEDSPSTLSDVEQPQVKVVAKETTLPEVKIVKETAASSITERIRQYQPNYQEKGLGGSVEIGKVSIAVERKVVNEQYKSSPPAKRSKQEVELSPAKRSKQEVELSPAKRSKQEVELSPAKRSKQEVELSPAKRSKQEVELSPAKRSKQEVELSPTKRSKQEVELSPAKRSKQEVELSPAKRSKQEVELSPAKKPKQVSLLQRIFHKRSHEVPQEGGTNKVSQGGTKRPRTNKKGTQIEAKLEHGKVGHAAVPDSDKETIGQVSIADIKERLKDGGVVMDETKGVTIIRDQFRH